MSRARRIIKGTTYFITRRCIFRTYLLRPDDKLNQLVGYCLAYVASKTGVIIHSYYVASNHIHLVLTDVEGRLPKFMQRLDGLLARAVNALRGRWDHFWESGSYSCVELLTDEAIWDKMVYTITNAVKDRLVHGHWQWPGLVSKPKQLGQWQSFKRPKQFFRDKSMPEQVALLLTPPPLSSGEDAVTVAAQLEQAVLAREAEIALENKQQGRSVLGRRAVLRQSFNDTPKSRAPRRKLNPRLAAKDAGVLAAAKEELLAFYAAYAQALEAFGRGVRDVLFPQGTYLMRERYAVCCSGPAG